MDPEKSRMKIAAVVLALIVVVAVVAVVAMPRDVSVEKEGDGTLSFEGEKSLRAFGSLEIDIQPGDGCFAKVYLDGDEVASDVTSYRYDAPFADFSKHEIKVVFESSAPVPEPDDKVTLTVQAGNGGTVDPEGPKKVAKGSVETLEITPDDGYVIDEVKIDGQNVSVCNVLDVKMDGDRTVSVSFRPVSTQDIAVTIDVDAKIEIRTTGGEIDFGKVVPSGEVKVRPGSSLKVSILLNPGFEIEDFKVDGKSVGKVTEYTIENIQKSVDISISVIKNVDGYTIKASAGNGGKISPSGDVKIEKGKDATFTFSAKSGYAVSDVTVDGKKVVASGSYTFKAVSGNHTISVTFKYVGGGGGGSVTPSKTLTKIEVTQQPTKTTYWKDETFDATGMKVTATYSDGSKRVLAASEYSISPSAMTEDTTKVTVSYGGKTCDVSVTVKYVTALKIERIDGRTWYKVGEIVTKDVLKVTATISDSTTEVVTDYEIAPSAPLKKDDQLSVTYRGYTENVSIDICEFDRITAVTEKKTYLIGEDFDKESMTVTAFYKNGSGEHEERVTDFSIDPKKSDKAGSYTVTVGYQEKTSTLTLTIVDPNEISSISITGPKKTQYFDDEELDTTGLVVTGKTNDGTEVSVPLDLVKIEEGTPESGKVTVTVTYKEKTATFEIHRTLEIHDVANLKHFAIKVNGGTSYSGKTIILMKDDIDLKDVEWSPIGTEEKKFEGTFDGSGKTISNLRAVLFGIVSGTVKDVTVKNAEIIGTPIFIQGGSVTLSGLKFEGSLLTDSVFALEDACEYGSGIITIKLSEGTYMPTSVHTSGGSTLSHVISIGVGCEVSIAPADGSSKDNIIFNGQFKVTGKLSVKSIVMQTSYNTGDISQFSLSGVAVMNEGEFHADDVSFKMTETGEYTAITAWWSSGKGTTINVRNSTFDCLGNRPIRSDGNVSVETCIFNDQYRYSIQLTSKASTMTSSASVEFKNNKIIAGSTVAGKPVYGVQLEGSTYGCSDLAITGSGNTIDFADTGKFGFLYYCDCGLVKCDYSDNPSITWNTEECGPVHNAIYISTAEQLLEIGTGLSTNQSDYKKKTIVILNDLDMTGKVWPVIELNNTVSNLSFKGYGDGITLSNLSLSVKNSGTKYSSAGFIASTGSMKLLSIEDIFFSELATGNVPDCGTNAVGAFVGYAGTSHNISITNCKVLNSTISGGYWTGGFVGYAAGYSKQDDGPVFEILTIENCAVENSTISSPGSAGGLIGHATGDSWTRDEFKSCTVKDCTITSTGTSTDKAGSLMGTVGAGQTAYSKDGGVFVTSYTVENNTVKSNNTSIDRIYGRQGTLGGVLCVDGSYVAFGNDDLKKMITSGDANILLPAGEYDFPTTLGDKCSVKGQSADSTVLKIPQQLFGTKSAAFENATLKIKNGNYQGFNSSEKVVFKNCVLEGQFFLYGPSVEFYDCKFVQTDSDSYNVWTYTALNVLFSECEFQCAGKAVLVYNEGGESGDMKIEFKGCTMNASSPVSGKAAIEVDSSLFKHSCTIVVDKATADGITGFGTGSKSGNSIWNNKKGPSVEGVNVTISVGGEVVYTETAISSLDSLDKVTEKGNLTLAFKQTFTIASGLAHEGEKARDVTFVGDGTQTVDVITKAQSAEGGMLNYQRGSIFTFKNLTIQAGEGSFDGIVCDEQTYINCTIKGKLTLYGKATFTNCTFDNTMANQYSIWTWGGTDVKFYNCTFNTNGKAILLYGQATKEKPTNLVVEDCTFNDRNNGAAGKAAIEIGNDYNATYILTTDNVTVNGFAQGKNTGSILWANKNRMAADHLSVTIDGKKVQ